MNVKTSSGHKLEASFIGNYFNNLIGMYFKILPLYENKEKSLKSYMENLRDELEGFSELIVSINNDPMFMSLISILQYLICEIDNDDCTVGVFKRKVFGAISLCKKLASKYSEEETR